MVDEEEVRAMVCPGRQACCREQSVRALLFAKNMLAVHVAERQRNFVHDDHV